MTMGNEMGATAARIAAVLAACVWVLAAGQAWGIDCDKARSAVEKRICANDALYNLDIELNGWYRTALDNGDHPEQTRKSQIAWVKRARNKCTTDGCLEAAYRERIAVLKAVPPYRWIKHTDPVLGVQFMVASNCRVTRNGNELSIWPFRPQDAGYVIHFVVADGNFEDAAKAEMFEKRDGKWYAAFGRFQNPPADEIKGDGWSGIKTVIGCGISDPETGFHAAGGECLWAVISDGKRAVVADTQGVPIPGADPEKSLMTLKFVPRRAKAAK